MQQKLRIKSANPDWAFEKVLATCNKNFEIGVLIQIGHLKESLRCATKLCEFSKITPFKIKVTWFQFGRPVERDLFMRYSTH